MGYPSAERSSRLLLRGREHNRSLAGEHAKGEGLLQIKPDRGIGVREVADRDVLPNVQLEIAASRGQDKRALDGRSPDDVAIDNALDVFQDGVAMIACFRELRVSFGPSKTEYGPFTPTRRVDSTPGPRHPDSPEHRREAS